MDDDDDGDCGQGLVLKQLKASADSGLSEHPRSEEDTTR